MKEKEIGNEKSIVNVQTRENQEASICDERREPSKLVENTKEQLSFRKLENYSIGQGEILPQALVRLVASEQKSRRRMWALVCQTCEDSWIWASAAPERGTQPTRLRCCKNCKKCEGNRWKLVDQERWRTSKNRLDRAAKSGMASPSPVKKRGRAASRSPMSRGAASATTSAALSSSSAAPRASPLQEPVMAKGPAGPCSPVRARPLVTASPVPQRQPSQVVQTIVALGWSIHRSARTSDLYWHHGMRGLNALECPQAIMEVLNQEVAEHTQPRLPVALASASARWS